MQPEAFLIARRNYRRMVKDVERHIKGANLTPLEWTTLYLVSEVAHCGPSDLTVELSISYPLVTHLIYELEDKRLITIITGVKDKRKRVLKLTGHGRKVLESLDSLESTL